MIKSGIDQQALIDQFAQASQQQAAQLRQSVCQATVGALQGRELSLKNIRSVLDAVAQAAGAGAAKNPLAGLEPTALLEQAVAGMDDALNQAVEANRVALTQLVQRGVDLRETHVKKALTDLDKLEDTLFGVLRKAAGAAAGAGAAEATGPWAAVLGKLQPGATQTASAAAGVSQQLTDQLAQWQSLVRDSRAASLKATQALADSYTSLVSGVLMGLADAMGQAGQGAPAGKAAKTARR